MVIRAEAVIDFSAVGPTFRILENEIDAVLAAIGDDILTLYERTVANWKVKPEFEMVVTTSTKEASVVAGTNNNVYRFLHDGTKKRWALMSADFMPKTHKRILGVAPGGGRAILRGRKQFAKAGRFDAQPGIPAREWSPEIIKRRQKVWNKWCQEAFDRAVGKGGAEVT